MFLVLVVVKANVELVWPQCSPLCVLQEAVVQAAVEDTAVGDHQAPIMVHEHRLQVTVETRGVEVSKGSVPVLDHAYT